MVSGPPFRMFLDCSYNCSNEYSLNFWYLSMYALLDMSHSNETKFVIIAISESIDCLTNLDKRVRSRFDNVQFVFPARPYNIEEMLCLLNSRLLLKSSENESNVIYNAWNDLIRKSLERFSITLKNVMAIGGFSVGFVLHSVIWKALIQILPKHVFFYEVE